MTNEETDSEETAPEGGWGWMVVIAVALNKMAFWGVLPCFAIVYADALSSRPGEEGTSISSIMGTFLITGQVAGCIYPSLHQKFSPCQVGTTGGLLYLLGSLGASFSDSFFPLIFTYGLMQGVGYGMMLPAGLTSFNLHFRRRRTIAMAAAQVVTGAGGWGLPLAAHALKEYAGPRAAKLAIAALTALAACAQLALRTPPPATRDTPAQTHALQPLCAQKGDDDDVKKNATLEDKGLHVGKTKGQYARSSSRNKVASCARSLWRRVWRMSGLSREVVRDPRVIVTACGISVVNIADISLFALLPLHLRGLHMNELQVAQTVTAATTGDLLGRVLLLLVGRWMGPRNRLAFAASATATAAATLALSFVTSWYPLIVLIGIGGMCKGFIYTTVFLTMAEIVPASEFPTAVAVILFCCILGGGLSPLLGWVLDVTGSFPTCFRLISGLLLSCPVAWGLLEAWRRRQRRHRRRVAVNERTNEPLQATETKPPQGRPLRAGSDV